MVKMTFTFDQHTAEMLRRTVTSEKTPERCRARSDSGIASRASKSCSKRLGSNDRHFFPCARPLGQQVIDAQSACPDYDDAYIDQYVNQGLSAPISNRPRTTRGRHEEVSCQHFSSEDQGRGTSG